MTDFETKLDNAVTDVKTDAASGVQAAETGIDTGFAWLKTHYIIFALAGALVVGILIAHI